MRPDRKGKPLYRKVNTRARGVRHRSGGDYRHDRHSKREKQAIADEVTYGSMHIKAQAANPGAKTRRGLDYTPLFRFLLSKVGQAWEPVLKEAVARLDKPDPVWWMVDMEPEGKSPLVGFSESTYFSRLTVDDDGLLVIVNPDVRLEQLWPTCTCCTHTFNGETFTNREPRGRYGVYHDPEETGAGAGQD